eukprot:CAMPEP_0183586254 /NCGR_PEP_ID=MMETSP0371-20130417/156889_1 /TAXON_ID=268820 /ORGANISM="Peridinium aciculiferum, Strain PAER-2" /LENGTH=77 /DNA_ID=CAMNT_0025797315 /DNA_START=14 /DNA_END=250 /DNA_ORIENTATION=+
MKTNKSFKPNFTRGGPLSFSGRASWYAPSMMKPNMSWSLPKKERTKISVQGLTLFLARIVQKGAKEPSEYVSMAQRM